MNQLIASWYLKEIDSEIISRRFYRKKSKRIKEISKELKQVMAVLKKIKWYEFWQNQQFWTNQHLLYKSIAGKYDKYTVDACPDKDETL